MSVARNASARYLVPLDLASDGTGGELGGVGVGEEANRVGLEVGYGEARTLVGTSW